MDWRDTCVMCIDGLLLHDGGALAGCGDCHLLDGGASVLCEETVCGPAKDGGPH